jgi:UDP-glucose 4-epimerase
MSSGRISNLSQIKRSRHFRIIRGDVTDYKTVKKAARNVDVICHLAAKVGVKRYVTNPLEVIRTNVLGTHNVLEVCRQTDLSRLVFASTSEIYGKNPNVPLHEESDRLLGSTQIDRWCYSTSKAVDEHLCQSYIRQHGLPIVMLRYFNMYGPRQDSSDYGGVVSIFIRRVLRNEAPEVHGDGQQTRSFGFITDAIDGTLTACLKKECLGEVINIGNPSEISILDLAKMIIKVAGKDSELKPQLIPYESFYGRYYEDLRRRVPDISKARLLLGFEPKVALEEGLRQTYTWYRGKYAS